MKIVRLIQKVLETQVIPNKYPGEHPLSGYCYVATETLWHLLGGMQSCWRPHRARDSKGIVHWWLQDATGNILDPTHEQYTDLGKTPPYEKGRSGGFLTKQPSKRSILTIRLVKDLL